MQRPDHPWRCRQRQILQSDQQGLEGSLQVEQKPACCMELHRLSCNGLLPSGGSSVVARPANQQHLGLLRVPSDQSQRIRQALHGLATQGAVHRSSWLSLWRAVSTETTTMDMIIKIRARAALRPAIERMTTATTMMMAMATMTNLLELMTAILPQAMKMMITGQ